MSKIKIKEVKARGKTLFILDISSFIFRAFFAIRHLSNSKGEPTNAIFGVASMLARLMEEGAPDYLVVTYDSKEPSFREALYEEYKANRESPPEALIPQFSKIDELVAKMKIPSFRKSGIEADDLIASLTKKWRTLDSQNNVVIVSSDKDLMQLVNPHVFVWDTMKDITYDEEKVEEKFGLPPLKIRDYLSLIGDSSDNIPGVPSIGPKTAVDLLKEFGDLENILAAAKEGKVKGKKGEVLKSHENIARLSQQLVTLKEDISMDSSFEAFHYHFELNAELEKFLKELDFHSLLKSWTERFSNKNSKQEEGAREVQLLEEVGESSEFRCVTTEKELLEHVEKIKEKGFFAIDLETTSLNPREAQIVGFAIAYDLQFGVYVPIHHTGAGSERQLPAERVISILKPLLENEEIKKYGQNLKYDYSVLRENGITLKNITVDTMVGSYVLDPIGRHNFDALCLKYLQYQSLTYEEVCGKGKDEISFKEVPLDLATRYAAEDAVCVLRLWEVIEPQLKNEGLFSVYSEIDLPLVVILAEMECQGVAIDSQWYQALSEKYFIELQEIQKKIDQYSDEPLNLNSTKQLAGLLFEKLKLPTQSKTKTGFSTDAKVLEALAPLHEVPRILLLHREIQKLKSTYIDPLPLLVDAKTNKVHAHFHQAVTATGRLSSSDPNLQNIPVRSERGQGIRKGFIASKGCVLLSADYSQIELRILAHMSGDPDLVQSFCKGEDIHRRTASDIYQIKTEEVSSKQREVAKAINFGLMYGKTAFGLSEELKISRKEAADMIQRYFSRYYKVKEFLDSLIINATEKGYCETLFGRKRKLPELQSQNKMIRANAERMAMNTPIQGTAADLMKLAMIRLSHALTQNKMNSRMTIQVHDEVVLDCPIEELDKVKKLVIYELENAAQFTVPLVVNVSTGANWMEL